MINSALSLARSEKSDKSFNTGLVLLQHCKSSEADRNAKTLASLAMFTLHYERQDFQKLVEVLDRMRVLDITSMASNMKVAVLQTLLGNHVEFGLDDDLLELVNKGLYLDKKMDMFMDFLASKGVGWESVLMDADLETCHVALSYGELLHAMRRFLKAKESYKKAIHGTADKKDFGELDNFGELFYSKRSEDTNGGAGLYKRAFEVLKDPEPDVNGTKGKMLRDMLALARGGYADVMCAQLNKKAEGEGMKLSENAWTNRHLSLAEALDISKPSSKLPIVDLRFNRVI